MSVKYFPFKDLTRRKFQSLLAFSSLTVCVATTTFLVLFGHDLGFKVTSFISGRLTTGFAGIFSNFIVVTVLLNSLAGILVTSFLIRITMSDRIRDIGVMKAIGCLNDIVFSYFTLELSVIIFASCGTGIILGILTNYASIGLLNTLGFRLTMEPPNPWLILLVFLSFIFVSYLIGLRLIINTIRLEPAKALSPLFYLKTTRTSVRTPRRLGFEFKLAVRSLMRRKRTSIQAAVCILVIASLVSLSISGGIVASETTQRYVERAIGQDIILVASPDVAEQYIKLLSKFFEYSQIEPINYADPKYMIPRSVTTKLSTVSGVIKTDPRLILETIVYELETIIPDPENPDQYIVIGDNRYRKALIIGVDPDSLVNNWLLLGEGFSDVSSKTAIIGDSLALDIFENPQNQTFRMLGEEFSISGICVDPLNNGDVVYVPLRTLNRLLEQPYCNLLLLQIDPEKRSATLNRIREDLSGTELIVVELDETLERYRFFLNLLWSLLLLLPQFSLINTVLCISGYFMLSITDQERDLRIMRALGAKPRVLMKLISHEAVIIAFISVAAGISAGSLIGLLFFIPDALVSWRAILSIVGVAALMTIVILLSSIYSTKKLLKKTPTRMVF